MSAIKYAIRDEGAAQQKKLFHALGFLISSPCFCIRTTNVRHQNAGR